MAAETDWIHAQQTSRSGSRRYFFVEIRRGGVLFRFTTLTFFLDSPSLVWLRSHSEEASFLPTRFSLEARPDLSTSSPGLAPEVLWQGVGTSGATKRAHNAHPAQRHTQQWITGLASVATVSRSDRGSGPRLPAGHSSSFSSSSTKKAGNRPLTSRYYVRSIPGLSGGRFRQSTCCLESTTRAAGRSGFASPRRASNRRRRFLRQE